ncbi:MAG TPA: hypothetical protein VK253_05200 [Candidatus Binatia bacterium]|nr:hypothetical protein [Candidatus Binatia bacterium]
MGTIKLTTINGNVQSVNPQNVTWSADSGSSGIQCDFDSTSIAYREDMIGMFFKIQDGFSSWFTITIPNSTPTDNYAITVTAKIGSVSHSITMWISVESSFITVSGTINAGNSGITPYQLQFHNLASTTDGYLATLTANTYSISIPNNQVYFVSVNDGTALDRTGLWHNLDTFFEVEVPAGSTSMTKDFTFGS